MLKLHWRRKWQPTPVFFPGKSHRQRILAGYLLWGCKELDTTKHTHIHTQALLKLFCGVSLYEFFVNIHSPEIIQFPVKSITPRLTSLPPPSWAALRLLAEKSLGLAIGKSWACCGRNQWLLFLTWLLTLFEGSCFKMRSFSYLAVWLENELGHCN